MKTKILFLILLLIIPSVFAGKITYKVNMCGKSMYPVINRDTYCSFVPVQTIKGTDVKIGDIICFNPDKRDYKHNVRWYVCHRVIDLSETHVYTKGDNNDISDNRIEFKYVALKVV